MACKVPRSMIYGDVESESRYSHAIASNTVCKSSRGRGILVLGSVKSMSGPATLGTAASIHRRPRTGSSKRHPGAPFAIMDALLDKYMISVEWNDVLPLPLIGYFAVIRCIWRGGLSFSPPPDGRRRFRPATTFREAPSDEVSPISASMSSETAR